MMDYTYLKRLERPKGPVDVVIDTDTYNEVDDQFALAYLIKNDAKLKLKAIYAAPFFNKMSSSPKDGMEKSYEEIFKVLRAMDREDLSPIVYKGSENYLPDEKTPVISPAAQDLAERAMNYTPEQPLYVVAIGAISNVASAVLLNPEIRDRIVLVWLGGHATHWNHTREFNMVQDIAGARVVLGCGMAVVQLPCMGVVSAFTISHADLEYHFRGHNALCDYLVDTVENEVATYNDDPVWSRVIWDVTAVGWLVDEKFCEDCLIHSPIPDYDGLYTFDNNRHFIRYVSHINRDALLSDLVKKLTE